MRGITIIFNDEEIHTGNDLDLVQEKKEIGKPTTQSFSVEVPGRNGLLNLTKALTGAVTYYNRPLSFQYFGTGDRDHLLELDAYMSRFHGHTIQIVDDDYPDHYYEGEASVNTELHGNYITIVLTVDAQPFRFRRDLTILRRDIDGTITLNLDNESIDVVPIVTVTGEITLTYKNTTTSLSAGTYSLDAFVLHGGVNLVEISGAGTISIEYREGAI